MFVLNKDYLIQPSKKEEVLGFKKEDISDATEDNAFHLISSEILHSDEFMLEEDVTEDLNHNYFTETVKLVIPEEGKPYYTAKYDAILGVTDAQDGVAMYVKWTTVFSVYAFYNKATNSLLIYNYIRDIESDGINVVSFDDEQASEDERNRCIAFIQGSLSLEDHWTLDNLLTTGKNQIVVVSNQVLMGVPSNLRVYTNVKAYTLKDKLPSQVIENLISFTEGNYVNIREMHEVDVANREVPDVARNIKMELVINLDTVN